MPWLSRETQEALGRLPELYRTMHAEGGFNGTSWTRYVASLRQLIPELDQLRVLDFGCGPRGGLRGLLGDRVHSYDPYVDEYSADPWAEPFDLFFSADVFEHLSPTAVNAVCRRLVRCLPRYIYLGISVRPAKKLFPDTKVNVHVLVASPEWWYGWLEGFFTDLYRFTCAEHDLTRGEVIFCLQRREAVDGPSEPV